MYCTGDPEGVQAVQAVPAAAVQSHPSQTQQQLQMWPTPFPVAGAGLPIQVYKTYYAIRYTI